MRPVVEISLEMNRSTAPTSHHQHCRRVPGHITRLRRMATVLLSPTSVAPFWYTHIALAVSRSGFSVQIVMGIRPFSPPQIGSVTVNSHPVSTQERHLSRH